MKKVKRILKVLTLVLLIIIASVGVGISGGVPIPKSFKRKREEVDKTELIDEENETIVQGKLKN